MRYKVKKACFSGNISRSSVWEATVQGTVLSLRLVARTYNYSSSFAVSETRVRHMYKSWNCFGNVSETCARHPLFGVHYIPQNEATPTCKVCCTCSNKSRANWYQSVIAF